MMHVDLSCVHNVFGVVVTGKRQTGVEFTAQANGCAIRHPRVEGVFLPLNEPVGWLGTGFVDALHELLCWDTERTSKRVAGLNELLAEVHLSLANGDLMEAWLPVVIGDASESSPLHDFREDHGFFVYPNCD